MAQVPPPRSTTPPPDGVAVFGDALLESAFFPADDACSLCFELFESRPPVQFACGHIVCSVCALQLFQKSELEACPSCTGSCSRERARAMLLAAADAAPSEMAELFAGRSAEEVAASMATDKAVGAAAGAPASGAGFGAISEGIDVPNTSFEEAPLSHVARADLPALPPHLGADSTSSMPLPDALVAMAAHDHETALEGAYHVRRYLGTAGAPPISAVIEAGGVADAVRHMTDTGRPRLQFEALWIVTNVASGSTEQTQAVVDAGAVPVLVRLLSSPVADIREQAAWCIGNIAGDSPALRDMLLASGVTTAMPTIMAVDGQPLSLQRNCTWACSNLVRGKPAPDLERVRPLIPALARCMLSDDEEVLSDACWGLSYLSDGSNDRIAAVLACGVATRLVEVMDSLSQKVMVPALRTLGNIVTGSDDQTDEVVRAGGIQAFHAALDSEKQSVVKEACWALSNVTAGSRVQIQCVIDTGCFAKLVTISEGGRMGPDVLKEASWVLCNAFAGGSAEQAAEIVGTGALCVVAAALREAPDRGVTRVTLDGLADGARSGGITATTLVNAGLMGTIEGLANGNDSTCAAAAGAVLEAI